ncbi:hypothetical protein QCA50_013935 [Cerrena zonata]|uniref:ABC transporter domain-containing protein n=1 Tax=Cerrena zonata TaxID=2478898 RepID=A0AAW0G023_9APHY
MVYSNWLQLESIPMTPDLVFPAMALLDKLSNPLLELPVLFNSLVEASVGLDRISQFLMAPEISTDFIEYGPTPKDLGEESLNILNTSFLWSKSTDSNSNYALQNIDFKAGKGELITIVGKVGSGKSSLLLALLGQLYPTPGSGENKSSCQINGTIAYAAQLPWISNSSVKDNILFGHRFDEKFYNLTLDACQLLPDLKQLPDGDETQVGEKGISLSGGQKARVALARAVYARSDIYLLDDVLSAVDSHVGKKIIEKVLGDKGLLATKTVILSTNSLSVLNYAHYTYLIESGKIIERGTIDEAYDEIKNPKLYELLSEFGKRDTPNESANVSREDSPEYLDKKSVECSQMFATKDNETEADAEVLSFSVVKSVDSHRRAIIATFHYDPFKETIPTLKTGPLKEISSKGAITVLSAATLAIFSFTTSRPLSAGMAGFVMSYALQITSTLNALVRVSADVESNVVAVERCLEYWELPLEEDEDSLRLIKPPITWPSSGTIEFKDYSTRYAENLDLVLKNITFSIKLGEKIGVVGRTGAGKSSLTLALFRMIQPVNGNIIIDEIDTTTLLLYDLRHNLSIIPQDSQLFEGTIRQNLNPLGYFTDEEVWKALELSHLKYFILDSDRDDLPDKLDSHVSEGGSNFSAGQRQLICLARALLSTSNILVLDEATAAVDAQTDKIIQETIRHEFKHKTVIAIAHRLDTVMQCDRILTLDHGEVKEFDSPQNLLQNQNEALNGLPQASPDAPPMDFSLPELDEDEKHDQEKFLLAKTYFNCKEFDRAAYVLKDCKSGNALFLKLYSTLISVDKKATEETDGSINVGSLQNSIRTEAADNISEYGDSRQPQLASLIDKFRPKLAV